MRCIDCEHFRNVQKPMMPWDAGRCICKKYELHCDYVSKQHLSRLECVEDDDMTFKECVEVEPTISQWIPVSERLPDDSKPVLVSVTVGGDSWCTTDFVDPYAEGTERWADHWNDDITAWMPLPEPYKGDDAK